MMMFCARCGEEMPQREDCDVCGECAEEEERERDREAAREGRRDGEPTGAVSD